MASGFGSNHLSRRNMSTDFGKNHFLNTMGRLPNLQQKDGGMLATNGAKTMMGDYKDDVRSSSRFSANKVIEKKLDSSMRHRTPLMPVMSEVVGAGRNWIGVEGKTTQLNERNNSSVLVDRAMID